MQSRPEQLTQPGGFGHRGGQIASSRCPRDGTLPTSGERHDVGVRSNLGEIVPQVDGSILLPAELAFRHQTGQHRIRRRRSGQQHEMIGRGEIDRLGAVHPLLATASPPGLGPDVPTVEMFLVPILGAIEGIRRRRLIGDRRLDSDLGAVHDRHADVTSGDHHFHRPVESVVVGHSQRGVAQLGRGLDQFIGMRCPIEERVIGMAVKLGVRMCPSHDRHSIEHVFDR